MLSYKQIIFLLLLILSLSFVSATALDDDQSKVLEIQREVQNMNFQGKDSFQRVENIEFIKNSLKEEDRLYDAIFDDDSINRDLIDDWAGSRRFFGRRGGSRDALLDVIQDKLSALEDEHENLLEQEEQTREQTQIQEATTFQDGQDQINENKRLELIARINDQYEQRENAPTNVQIEKTRSIISIYTTLSKLGYEYDSEIQQERETLRQLGKKRLTQQDRIIEKNQLQIVQEAQENMRIISDRFKEEKKLETNQAKLDVSKAEHEAALLRIKQASEEEIKRKNLIAAQEQLALDQITAAHKAAIISLANSQARQIESAAEIDSNEAEQNRLQREAYECIAAGQRGCTSDAIEYLDETDCGEVYNSRIFRRDTQCSIPLLVEAHTAYSNVLNKASDQQETLKLNQAVGCVSRGDNDCSDWQSQDEDFSDFLARVSCNLNEDETSPVACEERALVNAYSSRNQKILKSKLLSANASANDAIDQNYQQEVQAETVCKQDLLKVAQDLKQRASSEDVSSQIENAIDRIPTCSRMSQEPVKSLEDEIKRVLKDAESELNYKKSEGKDIAIKFSPNPTRVLGIAQAGVHKTNINQKTTIQITGILQPVGQTLNVGAKWQFTGPDGNDLRYALLGDVVTSRETSYSFTPSKEGVYIVQFQYDNNGNPVTFEWEYCVGNCKTAKAIEETTKTIPNGCDVLITDPIKAQNVPGNSDALMINGRVELREPRFIEKHLVYEQDGKVYCVAPSSPEEDDSPTTTNWAHCEDRHILHQLDAAKTTEVKNYMVINYYELHNTNEPFRNGGQVSQAAINAAKSDGVNLRDLMSQSSNNKFIGCQDPVTKEPDQVITPIVPNPVTGAVTLPGAVTSPTQTPIPPLQSKPSTRTTGSGSNVLKCSKTKANVDERISCSFNIDSTDDRYPSQDINNHAVMISKWSVPGDQKEVDGDRVTFSLKQSGEVTFDGNYPVAITAQGTITSGKQLHTLCASKEFTAQACDEIKIACDKQGDLTNQDAINYLYYLAKEEFSEKGQYSGSIECGFPTTGDNKEAVAARAAFIGCENYQINMYQHLAGVSVDSNGLPETLNSGDNGNRRNEPYVCGQSQSVDEIYTAQQMEEGAKNLYNRCDAKHEDAIDSAKEGLFDQVQTLLIEAEALCRKAIGGFNSLDEVEVK